MFSKLLLLGIAAVSAEIKHNDDIDPQYFITQFNSNEFPMGIGSCNPLNVLGQGGYQQATCLSVDRLSWDLYLSDDCTGTPFFTAIANLTVQTGAGTYFDFNCGVVGDDAYAAIEFGVGSCSTDTKVTMNAAVGVCTLTTDLLDTASAGWVSIDVYCDDTVAYLNYFETPDAFTGASCTDDEWYQTRNATTDCGWILTTDGTPVYGELTECVIVEGGTTTTEGGEETTTTEGSGSSSGASTYSMIGLLFAGIFVSLSM